MSLYAIGDPHLSLACDKPMDIFRGWKDYVSRLAENWKKTVCPSDTVVLVGDISWGMNLNEAEADFRFLHELPGQKIILKGNHDYWFSTKTKVEAFFQEKGLYTLKILFNNAFEYGEYSLCGTRGWVNEQGGTDNRKVVEREAGRLRLSLEAGKKLDKPPIAFLHYPPVYYINECREILEVLREYGVRQCYYGHIHGNGMQYAVDGVYQGIDFHLVSCDYVDFTPALVLP